MPEEFPNRPSDEDREARLDADEDATDLPKREAMSVLFDPTSALGGIAPTSPTTGGTGLTGGATPVGGSGLGGSLLGGGSTPPADPNSMANVPAPGGGSISLPHLPTPQGNPDGTYSPDTSSTSKT